MEWKSLKLFVASAVTLAVVSQIAKKVYKKIIMKKPKEEKANVKEICENKIHEINDVLMFSDRITYQYIKPAINHDQKLFISRDQQNSYKLLKYLKSARETLDICMYLITSNEIAESIIRLGKKRVMVRLIVDGDMAYSGGSQVKRLKEYSFIRVQCAKNSHLMHHKFCIIDGPAAVNRKITLIKYAEKIQLEAPNARPNTKLQNFATTAKGFVMSGSLNWSAQALNGSCDNVIVTSQPHVVHKFEKEFAKLWNETEGAGLKLWN